MPKLTMKAISKLHLGEVKVFVLDTFNELLSARVLLYRWKEMNPGYDYISKKENVDGKILLYITLYDHPVKHTNKPKNV